MYPNPTQEFFRFTCPLRAARYDQITAQHHRLALIHTSNLRTCCAIGFNGAGMCSGPFLMLGSTNIFCGAVCS
ncbi:hypothetical protein BDN70DRAFT_271570 [Pholiota conissans]|uniref:Uncharacterized protein n=1 Tax=Pholiota conissans TaxID=109636 RepID=A0A9P6CVY0_9AGAR|nr:hypothetical protein BDN70DRAFT_271570 [Pholiota conissans]